MTDETENISKEETLFQAPPIAEQERMVEALLFASAEPMSAKALNERMPYGSDAAEALVHLRKRYQGRGVHVMKVGDAYSFATSPDLSFLMQKRARGDTQTQPRSHRNSCYYRLSSTSNARRDRRNSWRERLSRDD